jgi:hypothetical protein
MTVLVAKMSNHFRVHFDDFGGDDRDLTSQVLRVTRPGLRFHNDFGIAEVAATPIELDLRDDVSDHTRCAVMTQVLRQIKEDAKFAVVIETLGPTNNVLEQWRLTGCRILDYRLDELCCVKGEGLLIRLTFDSERISVSLNGEMVVLS